MGITIAMTGSTGLLGRNILFEILGRHSDEVDEVIVMGGRGRESSLGARIEQMLAEDGLDCMGVDAEALPALMSRVRCVEMDLAKDDLGLSEADLAMLSGTRIDTFIHNAAATTFKSDDKAWKKVMTVNVEGLGRLLGVCQGLEIGKFIHISSAYSAGQMEGHVKPDALNLNGLLANPYQYSKAIGEMMVREFERETGCQTVIMRPATIGGRLLDGQRGAVNKFDVYLGWAKAVLRMKTQMLGSLGAALNTRIELPLRLAARAGSGLNIVPVDWCARCIVYAATHDTEHDAYHLANHELTPHEMYFSMMLDAIGIDGVTFTNEAPSDPNPAEDLYYSKLGSIFALYIEPEPLVFDTGSQSELERGCGVVCPKIDREAFGVLLQYAVERQFGLEDRAQRMAA